MWRSSPAASDGERRAAQVVTAVSTALFVLVLCQWRPQRFFARAGFTSDFYDAQAAAFWRGRLSVPADVAGIEGFLIGAKTYLYYGPMLAVARMPTALFGSWADGRLTRLSMTIAFVALCTVVFHLTVRLRRATGVPSGAAWRPALMIAAVACSPVLALAGQVSVYHETELWAFVLLLLTFVLLIEVMRAPSMRSVGFAGIVAIATILTRVSIGLGALTALGIVGLMLWRRDRRLSLTAIGLAIAGFLANVGINFAKFGTLLDLPANRQVLTLLDPDRAEWFAANGNSFFGLGFLPTTVVHYLRPDAFAVERLAPFIRFGPRAREFGSTALESNTASSSLTASATLLMVMAAIGVAIVIRRRRRVTVPLIVGAAVAALPTLAIGFIANRYLVDLLALLTIPAAIAIVEFHTNRRLLGQLSIGALFVWGVWINTSLATWLDSIDDPGFTAWRYDLDDALFGGSPPSVIALSGPAPRDGIVAIDGECDGLYIAIEGRWVALELADGVRRIGGEFDPTIDPTVLTGGSGETITVATDADGDLQVTYTSADSTTVDGSSVAWDGDPVVIDIVSDPTADGIGRGLRVRIDGAEVLASLDTPDLASMSAGPGFEVTAGADRGTPICYDLLRRR